MSVPCTHITVGLSWRDKIYLRCMFTCRGSNFNPASNNKNSYLHASQGTHSHTHRIHACVPVESDQRGNLRMASMSLETFGSSSPLRSWLQITTMEFLVQSSQPGERRSGRYHYLRATETKRAVSLLFRRVEFMVEPGSQTDRQTDRPADRRGLAMKSIFHHYNQRWRR